jgi:oxygen-dependent protoporphyrinogen oxidase
MGQLIDALVAAVGQNLQLDAPVRSVRREGAELVVERVDGKRDRATAVVLAIPARAAAGLLAGDTAPEIDGLNSAPLLSNVSVNLTYRREDVARYPAGSGVIFPQALAREGLRALSMVDQKFPGRAPHGTALVRVFFRPQRDALTSWSDDRFTETAARAIAQVLAPRAEPERAWVSRWADALPVFTPEYRAQAARADVAWQARGVHAAGSAFHGAGIDAAVASAERVAARLTT